MITSVSPSTAETAFSCPHCGAYTTQHWYRLHAEKLDHKSPLPHLLNAEDRADLKADSNCDPEVKANLLAWMDKMAAGLTVFSEKGDYPFAFVVHNSHLSECFNCHKHALWIGTSLIHPTTKLGPTPNPDLPQEIQADFEEARAAMNVSPRGAAALLRLCVQKMCSHLGERGQSIDADIAALVQKGLSPVVQQALDVVRVVGNEAVHPGTLDLRDDPDTVIQLLQLINLIAEQMISIPRSVQQLYDKLPPGKKAAIEARDAKSASKRRDE